MPGYKGHIAGALTASGAALSGVWWLGLYRPGPQTLLMLAALAVLGALFPDVDTSSKGRCLYYGAAALADAAFIVAKQYKMAAVLGFCAILPAVGAHRGWTHTWWAGIMVPGAALLGAVTLLDVPWRTLIPYYLAAVLGYYSHLALDRTF